MPPVAPILCRAEKTLPLGTLPIADCHIAAKLPYVTPFTVNPMNGKEYRATMIRRAMTIRAAKVMMTEL